MSGKLYLYIHVTLVVGEAQLSINKFTTDQIYNRLNLQQIKFTTDQICIRSNLQQIKFTTNQIYSRSKMKLNRKAKKNLRILGFPEDTLPKMKELRRRYLELSLIRHPDKATGTDEDFQELLYAYESIGKLIEKSENTDREDVEEDEARKKFKESNFEKVNKTSVTVKILATHVEAWNNVFTEKFGNPIVNDANASKQWSVPYEISQADSGTIKVTIWNLTKKKQSTMLIQGEHMKQYLNISFAENAVPKLFTEVLSRLPQRIHGVEESNLKRKLRQSVRRPCKKCTMVFTTVSDLNRHVLKQHENKANMCDKCDKQVGSKAAMEKHVE